jgi:NodT family efflux transporter outer membrane factor (OMF) lipoprotein
MVGLVATYKSLTVAIAGLALAGCASLPQLGARPELVRPSALGAEQAFAGPRGAWPGQGWWRAYGDPQLDLLIAEALAGSPEVAAAAARVRAAEAIAEQAGAVTLPQVGLEASAGGQKQSYNLGIPRQFVPRGVFDTGRIAGNFSFDLDLWGRNRAALAAATSEAQAAAVDAEQAALLLSTTVASSYAELARLHAARDVAVQAATVRQETAVLTTQRVANGLDTLGEQRQAEARVPSARAEIAAFDEAIALTRNRIAALLGRGPDRGLLIVRPKVVATPLGLPDTLALDLLGRRPDIVGARLRAEAAASRINVARADFYPNINLAAVIGLQSFGLDQLFESGSTFGTAGPAISLPLFQGGRLGGAYRGARAQYDESVARYDAILVTALREVADAAASLKALDVQLTEQRQALAAADQAARIARIRYQGGLANQLTALQADDSLLAIRRDVVELEARRFALNVALVRALGGGFQAGPNIAAGQN